jgi:hypothetical protein
MDEYNDVIEMINKYSDVISLDEQYTLHNMLIFAHKFDYDLIKFVMYEKFGYIHDSIKLFDLKENRLYQNIFRKSLIDRYKTCVISNDGEIVCEACHIIPYVDCNKNEKYDINNGILLTSSLHKLFDTYMFSINPDDKRVHFNKKILNDNNYCNHTKYSGEVVKLNNETCRYLKNHYNKFIVNELH